MIYSANLNAPKNSSYEDSRPVGYYHNFCANGGDRMHCGGGHEDNTNARISLDDVTVGE